MKRKLIILISLFFPLCTIAQRAITRWDFKGPLKDTTYVAQKILLDIDWSGKEEIKSALTRPSSTVFYYDNNKITIKEGTKKTTLYITNLKDDGNHPYSKNYKDVIYTLPDNTTVKCTLELSYSSSVISVPNLNVEINYKKGTHEVKLVYMMEH